MPHHVQGVGQVCQADEGALDPVVARPAAVDIQAALDAVVGKDALQRFAAPFLPGGARLVLLCHRRADFFTQAELVTFRNSAKEPAGASGLGLGLDFVQQDLGQRIIGRGHPHVARAARGDLHAGRIDVIPGFAGRDAVLLQAVLDGAVVEKGRVGMPASIRSTASAVSAAGVPACQQTPTEG